jgi:uncharacterized membrane protein YccC
MPADHRAKRIWQGAARLRKPAVPDWLTAVIPPWLAAAMRPRRAPVPWPEMARAGIAICVPMAAGIATGERALGLLMAFGGLIGIVVDYGGPFVVRLRRVGSAAVFGGAVGLTVGSLIHGRGWITVIALLVLACFSALLSAVSDVGSATGLQLMVYASIAGLGPLGTLRPWWHAPLGFLLGALWAVVLTVPGWLLSPRAAEQRSVAPVYRALAGQLGAIGTADVTQARRTTTAALNTAYDTLLTARSTAGGRSLRMTRLMALLNQGNLISEAVAALGVEGTRPPQSVIATFDRLADVIETHSAPPDIPTLPTTSPAARALQADLAGLRSVLSRNWAPPNAPPAPKRTPRDRLGALADRVNGRLTLIFALRLMACVGVASVLCETLPLQRPYWVVLTAVIVLKPDFGSVFARAVQRGLGTVVGAVLGAVIIIVVPYGPWLLLPACLLAVLLPYGRSRNFALQAVFLTPLVVLFIDLLAPGGWQLAVDRLVDTLLGCAVVLLVGYAPWPSSWHAHLPGRFAAAARDVCRYLEAALITTPVDRPGAAPAASPASTREERARLRRQAFRALSDLRAEFERTMSEPSAVSRQASAWWPAVVGLEEVALAVTGTAVAVSHGSAAPCPDAVRQLMTALEGIADAIGHGTAPPTVTELPSDAVLRPTTEAVRAVMGVLASQNEPAHREESVS